MSENLLHLEGSNNGTACGARVHWSKAHPTRTNCPHCVRIRDERERAARAAPKRVVAVATGERSR